MKSFKVWLMVGLLVTILIPAGSAVLAESISPEVAGQLLPKLEALKVQVDGLKQTVGRAIITQIENLIADTQGVVDEKNKALLGQLLPQVKTLVAEFDAYNTKFVGYQCVINTLIAQMKGILGTGSGNFSCSGSGGSGGGSGGGGSGGSGGSSGSGGDNSSLSVDLKVDGSNGPVSVVYNTSFTVSWNVSDVGGECRGTGSSDFTIKTGGLWNSFVASGSGSAAVAVASKPSGSLDIGISCTKGSSNTASDSVSLIVTDVPPVTVTKTISNVVVNSLVNKVWYGGDSKNVSWQSTGLTGINVDIIVCDYNGLCSTVAYNTANDGSQAVIFPLSMKANEGKDYYVKVRKTGDNSISAQSADFIYGLPSISNVVVNGLEKAWYHNETKTISWNSVGLGNSTVDIILCNSTKCWPGVMNTANDGSQTMKLYMTDKPEGEDYYIKVRKYNNELVSAKSSIFSTSKATVASSEPLSQTALLLLGIDKILFDISEALLGE
jgi:hypothetical protein